MLCTKITLDRCGEQTCLLSRVSMYATQHDPKWPLVTETVRFRTSTKQATPVSGDEVVYMDKTWVVEQTKQYPNACRAVTDCRRVGLDMCNSTTVDVYQFEQDYDCDGEDTLVASATGVEVALKQIGTTSEVINGGRTEVRRYRVYSPSAGSWNHLTHLNGSVDLKVQEVVLDDGEMPYAICVEHPFPLSEI